MRVNWMLVITTILCALGVSTVQAQTSLTCEQRCADRAEQCRWEANGIYITCGQQGGTEEACKKKRDDYLASCGCSRCSRLVPCGNTVCLKSWYCECGEPVYGDDSTTCGLTFDGGYSNPCDCNPDDPACTSPIIMDLASNGLHLTNVAMGVKFDLRLTGPIQTAWTQPNSDDAWLVLDRDGNGTIDSGAELFGNVTAQPERPEKNGFYALAEFDKVVNGGNGDGLITSADIVYSSLRLWQDKDHNGVSEPDELKTLLEFSIESIALDFSESRRMDPFGNLFRYRAKVNGVKFAYDVFLTHEQQQK